MAAKQDSPAEFGPTPEEDPAGVVAVLLVAGLSAAAAAWALRR